MGDDQRIVTAARVSYGDGTSISRSDKNLIDFLVRKRHTSPIEHVKFTFRMEVPIFVMRQLQRHRVANLSEVSGRYSIQPNKYYYPAEWRKQAEVNRQASGEAFQSAVLDTALRDSVGHAHATYERFLEAGVARELARINLPVNLYTGFYWTIDAKNLLDFLRLRLADDAQWEFQQYAKSILGLIKPIIPHTIEAWEEHQLHAATFSRAEMMFIRDKLDIAMEGVSVDAYDHTLSSYGLRKSHRQEFMEKVGAFDE